MKLELKNIKHSAWASEETHCYQASLYVDGKPVASVSNDGHGGADRYYDHPKCVYSGRSAWCDKMQEVHEYFKSLPHTHSLEFWCADQVNDWLSARELKRKLKKEFLYTFVGDCFAGSVYGSKVRPSRANVRVAVVLNDMPFADALAIWKETA